MHINSTQFSTLNSNICFIFDFGTFFVAYILLFFYLQPSLSEQLLPCRHCFLLLRTKRSLLLRKVERYDIKECLFWNWVAPSSLTSFSSSLGRGKESFTQPRDLSHSIEKLLSRNLLITKINEIGIFEHGIYLVLAVENDFVKYEFWNFAPFRRKSICTLSLILVYLGANCTLWASMAESERAASSLFQKWQAGPLLSLPSRYTTAGQWRELLVPF